MDLEMDSRTIISQFERKTQQDAQAVNISSCCVRQKENARTIGVPVQDSWRVQQWRSGRQLQMEEEWGFRESEEAQSVRESVSLATIQAKI